MYICEILINKQTMRQYVVKIAYILAITVILSSCSGLGKMRKNSNLIDFKVLPETLETHGGKVDVAIDGLFPAKYFNKNVTLVVKPVLKFQSGEQAFDPITVQGERVGDNHRVISYDDGGSFNYKDAVTYHDKMRDSELEIRMSASKGSKVLAFDPVIIAKGVQSTSSLVVNKPATIIGVVREKNTTGRYNPFIDEFQRIVPDHFTADIRYLVNQSNLRSSEITKSDIQKLQQFTRDAYMDERQNLKGIEISAYASPEGRLEVNTRLSEERKETSSGFVKDQLKKEDIETQLNTKFTPEDWEGFQELMEESNIQDKDLILRVLSMYNDPEIREREIRNLSEAYAVVAEEILPQLRRAKITANVDFIGRTDEEIAQLADTRPTELTPAELLYAATLTSNKTKKLKLYDVFQQVYPDDWRGYNNSGVMLFEFENYEDALDMFEKAEKLKNDEPIIKNNLGAVALVAENIEVAETMFGAASGAGAEAIQNLGIVALKQGQYDKAVQLLGNADTPNVGLAKILTGDNNGALRSLESCTWENSAMTEYFKAIVAARTANDNLMFESLGKAVKLDPKLKDIIATDVEFVKYFDNAQFNNIVR